jgi:adenylyl-sulfate reductase (glutathione)
MALSVSSSIAISTSTFQSSQPKLPQIGSIRVLDRPYDGGVGVKLSQPRRSFVKPINAAERQHTDSVLPIIASEATETEEVDFQQLASQLENASPLQIMDTALAKFGNDIAIAFR